jgi:hypothetical protein
MNSAIRRLEEPPTGYALHGINSKTGVLVAP